MATFEFLGPYRVGDSLGRGGMGSVFKAVHEKTGEQVAVKVISASVADDIRFRRRFNDEVEALKKLRHPNIVSLIGYGEQNGQLFYSMELVTGENLQHKLKREKRLRWPFILDLGIDVCNALKHAHNFGIYHRDIKPANLLFAEDGTTKIVDFGIAKIFGNTEQTAVGAVLGTADYMAPEQANGGPITPRTDLYALGAVLYACFAGRPPFSGKTLTQVLDLLLREPPPPLQIIAADVPDDVRELIHALLEKDPSLRPPTALAVMNRLKAIRAGLMHLEASERNEPAANDAEPLDRVPTDESPTFSNRSSRSDQPTIVVEDLVAPGNRTAASGLNAGLTAADQAAQRASVPDASTRVKPATHASLAHQTRQPDDPLTKVSALSPSSDDADQDFHTDAPKTHFNTVSDQERQRSVLVSDPHEPESHRWLHHLSIVFLIGLLLVATGIFLWSMKRPSAEDLYQDILAAREQGDMPRHKALLEQFTRLYPYDQRAEELEPLVGDVDTLRVMRRLRLKSLRDGGDEYLAPHESTFLEAFRLKEQDPARAKTILEDWLAVYAPTASGPLDKSNEELAAMIRVARVELAQLAQLPSLREDVRVKELLATIEAGSAALSPVEESRMLTGLIQLYADKPWAKLAVDAAQQRLQQLPTSAL